MIAPKHFLQAPFYRMERLISIGDELFIQGPLISLGGSSRRNVSTADISVIYFSRCDGSAPARGTRYEPAAGRSSDHNSAGVECQSRW